MITEQDKTLEALQAAIEMEIDGKECYLEASKQSSNEVGKNLLQSLADEEDIHQRKLRDIYEAIRSKKAWPATDFRSDQSSGLMSTFAGTCEAVGGSANSAACDFDAIKAAVEKEKKSYDFYNRQSQNAIYDAERILRGSGCGRKSTRACSPRLLRISH